MDLLYASTHFGISIPRKVKLQSLVTLLKREKKRLTETSFANIHFFRTSSLAGSVAQSLLGLCLVPLDLPLRFVVGARGTRKLHGCVLVADLRRQPSITTRKLKPSAPKPCLVQNGFEA